MSALSPQHPVALRTGHPGVLQPVIPTAPLHPNPNPTPKLMVQNGKGHLLAEKPPQSLLFAIWTGSLGTAASYQGRLPVADRLQGAWEEGGRAANVHGA